MNMLGCLYSPRILSRAGALYSRLGHVYVAAQTALSVSAQMDCDLREGGWRFCLRSLCQREALAGPPPPLRKALTVSQRGGLLALSQDGVVPLLRVTDAPLEPTCLHPLSCGCQPHLSTPSSTFPAPMTSVAAPRPPPTPTPWPCNQPLPGLQVIRPRAGAEKKRMGLQGIASAERCWHVSIATWGKYFMQKSICCSIKGVPANN